MFRCYMFSGHLRVSRGIAFRSLSPNLLPKSQQVFSTQGLSSSVSSKARSSFRILGYVFYATAGALFLVYASDTRALVNSHVITPLLHTCFDPEEAHKLAILALRLKIVPKERVEDTEVLETEIFGHKISNPVWLAAGFDKNAEAVDALLDLGFGAVEIGSVTPVPQPGNPPPRVFRLTKDNAIINRYGFNSYGADVVALNLKKRLVSQKEREGGHRSLRDRKLLGINLGKNRTSPLGSVDDYFCGIENLASLGDYIVLNVSSPNTPGLVKMQNEDNIKSLIDVAIKTRDSVAKDIKRKIPLCIKISPDLTNDEIRNISSIALLAKVDGIIAANTTSGRPGGLSSDSHMVLENGGLSGPPIKPRALDVVREVKKVVANKIPIIACGGISSAEDALEFASAGATVVQLYTSIIYNGPGIATKIKTDLSTILKERNTSWKELVLGSQVLEN